MSKTLVTGGSGFVGRALVQELLADGRQVRVLARHPEHPALQGLAVEVVQGDLRHPDSLRIALEGCSYLFHVAADYRLWVPNPKDMYATNVEGTRHILRAAWERGLERVVYTSTVGTLGNPGDGTPGREDTPVSFADMVGHYKKSKFLAEQIALEFARRGLPLVLVNPSTPVGPWDYRPTPTGQMIVDFLNGQMPAYLDSGLNLIHVRDVARGHILAEERGRPGEKYILGHQNLSLSEIFEILAGISQRPAPRWRLPYYPILGLAYVNEFWATWVSHRPPRIPLTAVKMAGKFMYFDSSKAMQELGLPQTPVREALQDAITWFQKHGYVKENKVQS
ncbi:MAG: NAD-dependent epimerase/dehydratase family protein [Deltaproteobacteria bacterium]|nr:NAD-dependent epimerase/dehydratase family protein [Deltaproteobacteria bacterium]MBW1986336.1 NAD-dependent epimerase/dehydratase family protein [Deltaproteobacteria bacterium]